MFGRLPNFLSLDLICAALGSVRCTSNARCYGAVPTPPELRPAAREACAVLAFGGNLETRASAQTSKFLIPKSFALPARGSYRVAWTLHRSGALLLG